MAVVRVKTFFLHHGRLLVTHAEGWLQTKKIEVVRSNALFLDSLPYLAQPRCHL